MNSMFLVNFRMSVWLFSLAKYAENANLTKLWMNLSISEECSLWSTKFPNHSTLIYTLLYRALYWAKYSIDLERPLALTMRLHLKSE